MAAYSERELSHTIKSIGTKMLKKLEEFEDILSKLSVQTERKKGSWHFKQIDGQSFKGHSKESILNEVVNLWVNDALRAYNELYESHLEHHDTSNKFLKKIKN